MIILHTIADNLSLYITRIRSLVASWAPILRTVYELVFTNL